MSYILTNGCSYTDKRFGKKSGNWMHTDEEKKELGIPNDVWPMWPDYVSKKMGIKNVNLAKSGASNGRMHRTSLEQILISRPKVLMHLWTSAGRDDHWNEQVNPYDYIRAVYIAGELMQRNPAMFDKDKRTMMNQSQGQLAFRMISIYYPNEINKIIRFYTDWFQSDHDSLIHLLNCIRIDDTPVYKGLKKAEYDNVNASKNGKALETSIRFWCHMFWEAKDYSDSELEEMNTFILNAEFQPILDTYYMTKSENLPFISLAAINLDPQWVHLGGYHEELIEKATKTHSGQRNGLWKIFDDKEISRSKMNVFEKMSLSIRYAVSRRINLILNNETFKKLDDLVYNGEYNFHHWPPLTKYNTNADIMSRPDWKPISEDDQHPHPDYQQKIGDIFYDLYQKNYS